MHVADDHRIHILSIASRARIYKSISTHLGPMSTAQWAVDREGRFWLFTGGHRGVICAYRIRITKTLIGNEEVRASTSRCSRTSR